MKELFIVRGLPGSGKSTLAKFLIADKNGIIIENDQFMIEDGLYVWKESKMKHAIRHVNETLHKALSNNIEVIVISNVSAREGDFNNYIQLAKNKGYNTTSIIVENRNNTKSTHHVDDQTMMKMESNFQVKLR